MKIASTFIFLLVVLHSVNISGYAQKKQVQASFCKLSLSNDIKLSNTTFTNIYRIRIGADNLAAKINKVAGHTFINDNEVKDCVKNWTFKNFAENTSFLISISWKHGYGWQPIRITSGKFSKTIKPN